jgi:hypothetical protein
VRDRRKIRLIVILMSVFALILPLIGVAASS